MRGLWGRLSPPGWLIFLKSAAGGGSTAPSPPAGPSCGPQLPTTTSVSVTPVTTGLAVTVAAVAGADDAAGGVGGVPQAVTSSAASNRATLAAPGRDRCCGLESCPFKNSLSFLSYPAPIPPI